MQLCSQGAPKTKYYQGRPSYLSPIHGPSITAPHPDPSVRQGATQDSSALFDPLILLPLAGLPCPCSHPTQSRPWDPLTAPLTSPENECPWHRGWAQSQVTPNDPPEAHQESFRPFLSKQVGAVTGTAASPGGLEMTLGCHHCHLGQQKWAWVRGWASPKRGGPLSQEAQDPPWACLHAVHQHLQGILPYLPYPEPWVALKCVPRTVRPHGVVTKKLSGLWLPTRLHPEVNITCPGSIHPQKAES